MWLAFVLSSVLLLVVYGGDSNYVDFSCTNKLKFILSSSGVKKRSIHLHNERVIDINCLSPLVFWGKISNQSPADSSFV